MFVSQSVKLPDSVYQAAKDEAEAKDTTIGSVVMMWRTKAAIHDDSKERTNARVIDE